MQSGDIGSEIAPRLIVVFEHTIGTLTPGAERKRRLLLKAHQHRRAAACWTIDTHMTKVMVDWAYRTPYNIDVATFTEEDEAERIEQRLVGAGIPFGNFLVVTVEELARVHANMPHIAAIFDADPAHRWTYGSKSRCEARL